MLSANSPSAFIYPKRATNLCSRLLEMEKQSQRIHKFSRNKIHNALTSGSACQGEHTKLCEEQSQRIKLFN